MPPKSNKKGGMLVGLLNARATGINTILFGWIHLLLDMTVQISWVLAQMLETNILGFSRLGNRFWHGKSWPAAESSICDPIGSHVPLAIGQKIWAGSYVDFALVLKQTRYLRTDLHVTGELVIKNGQHFVKKHCKQLDHCIHIIHVYIPRKVPRESPGNVKVHDNIRLADKLRYSRHLIKSALQTL